MRFALTQTAAPSEEPVTLADAKAQIRLDEADDATLLPSMIGSARRKVDEFTRRQLVTATFTLKLDRFPSGSTINVPRPPLRSVGSITYVDTGGSVQTLAASVYTVDTDSHPGRISLAFGQVWPAIREQDNSIIITFDAGYGGKTAVPYTFKDAIRLLSAHRWENREAVVTGMVAKELPEAVTSLLWMERIEVLETRV